jgi:putative inorganic carbon (HCO3(-)) transporter
VIASLALAPATRLPGAGTLAVYGAVALVAIVLLGLLMHRREDALPLLAVLALPFRVPVSADNKTVNLLIPLYVVVAAGTIVHLVLPALARRRAAAPPAPRRL